MYASIDAGSQTVRSALLRSVRASDFPLLLSLRSDRALQTQLLTIPDSVDAASVQSWITRRSEDAGGAFLVIENAIAREPVGYAQIANVHRRNGIGYGGLAIVASSRGRGIGRCALQELMSFSRTALGLRKLLAEIKSDNDASVRLHLSLGYRIVGELKDHFVDETGIVHDVLLLECLLSDPPA